MGRPRKIPAEGDVGSDIVAQLLDVSVEQLEVMLPELLARRPAFPGPDPTTGKYCIEAVRRWRLARHTSLFPELTGVKAGVHAGTVFDERRRQLFGDHRP